MNTLLIPTDFSPIADNALEYALDMAATYHLNITLLHVVLLSTPTVPEVIYVDVLTDIQKHAEEKMEKKMADLIEQHPSINFYSKVETGLFLDTLDSYCNEIKPIAIVMGITGDGTSLEKLIGSNTLLAMKSTSYPLIVVPKHAHFKQVEKICFACDLKDVTNSTPVLAIKTFAKFFNAEIHILNIDYHNRHYTANTALELDVLTNMFETIEPKFHFIENENLQDAINDFIDVNNIDLLIMLPKKHSFFESLFRKSQTKEMLYQSHIPILALHSN